MLSDNMNKMYAVCRLEKAWHVYSVSPWCAVFSEEELKVSLSSVLNRLLSIENMSFDCMLTKIHPTLRIVRSLHHTSCMQRPMFSW
jgi:hypothetical protein